MPPSSPVPPSDTELVDRAVAGDRAALASLFTTYRPRLSRIATFRMDPRLAVRIDVDDMLQDTFLAAAQRLPHILRDAPDSIFLWLRMILGQTLVDLHRRHLGAQSRNAARDRSLDAGWDSNSTSASLRFSLLGSITSPSEAALRQEAAEQLDTALQTLGEADREILALRHFEELSNREASRLLEISEPAASLRYTRALVRLKAVMETLPGGFSEDLFRNM
jgi:RNA polymerase sigma-70 factor (ECF subfamily)